MTLQETLHKFADQAGIPRADADEVGAILEEENRTLRPRTPEEREVIKKFWQKIVDAGVIGSKKDDSESIPKSQQGIHHSN